MQIWDGWEMYQKYTIPTGAPEVQVIETYKAFFGGACFLLELMAMISALDPATQAQTIADLESEMAFFKKTLNDCASKEDIEEARRHIQLKLPIRNEAHG